MSKREREDETSASGHQPHTPTAQNPRRSLLGSIRAKRVTLFFLKKHRLTHTHTSTHCQVWKGLVKVSKWLTEKEKKSHLTEKEGQFYQWQSKWTSSTSKRSERKREAFGDAIRVQKSFPVPLSHLDAYQNGQNALINTFARSIQCSRLFIESKLHIHTEKMWSVSQWVSE